MGTRKRGCHVRVQMASTAQHKEQRRVEDVHEPPPTSALGLVGIGEIGEIGCDGGSGDDCGGGGSSGATVHHVPLRAQCARNDQRRQHEQRRHGAQVFHKGAKLASAHCVGGSDMAPGML